MRSLAARHAPEEQSGDLETGRELLGEILAAVRRIELLAAQRPGDRLLAAAALRATEVGEAAENLTARQIDVREMKVTWFARGRTSMAAEVAARKHLRPVS